MGLSVLVPNKKTGLCGRHLQLLGVPLKMGFWLAIWFCEIYREPDRSLRKRGDFAGKQVKCSPWVSIPVGPARVSDITRGDILYKDKS